MSSELLWGVTIMVRAVRVVGIAIGSLVIAYLAVWLVAGVLFGWGGGDRPLTAVVAIVLGGLVFTDIIGRERRKARRKGSAGA